jgi:hypothetical protein
MCIRTGILIISGYQNEALRICCDTNFNCYNTGVKYDSTYRMNLSVERIMQMVDGPTAIIQSYPVTELVRLVFYY